MVNLDRQSEGEVSASIYPIDLERKICDYYNLDDESKKEIVKMAREITPKTNGVKIDRKVYEFNLNESVKKYILG